MKTIWKNSHPQAAAEAAAAIGSPVLGGRQGAPRNWTTGPTRTLSWPIKSSGRGWGQMRPRGVSEYRVWSSKSRFLHKTIFFSVNCSGKVNTRLHRKTCSFKVAIGVKRKHEWSDEQLKSRILHDIIHIFLLMIGRGGDNDPCVGVCYLLKLQREERERNKAAADAEEQRANKRVHQRSLS